ncbi:MAG: aldehyde dehydrogenase family protein [Nitrospirota bacterium]|nr:aldehyde dehydrogenase family protein [Nitrospirota bacterium]
MDAHELTVAGTAFRAHHSDPVTNPFTGDTIAQVPQAGPDAVEAAISAAVTAFHDYREWPAHRRARLLSDIAAAIAGRRSELAGRIVEEGGKPITQAQGEVDRAVTTFTIAAEEAKRLSGEVLPVDITAPGEGYVSFTRRVPVGPVSAISPFNFPLNLVAHKLAPALAAGCPMVLKPPVQTPLTPLLLQDIVVQAGAPHGLFTVIPCSVEHAQPLITDDRMAFLSFTGSDRVGWQIKALSGKKRVALELGGNAAVIVCPDVDLAATAKRVAFGAFAYAGQICISVQRIFVQHEVYEPFMAELVRATEALAVGDPRDPNTVCGPLIDTAAADRVASWVQRAVDGGATLRTGGQRDGNVIRPVVLTDAPAELEVCCQEVFGPVAVAAPFDTFKQAVEMVNTSRFGLQAGVFTRDLSEALYAHRHLEVGGVVVGDIPTLRFDHTPYGGVRDSGLGREGVRYVMDELTEPRLLLIKEN